MTTLILAIVSIALNLVIMVFHGERLRNSIVSFMFFILSLSDFCTGFCAFLHTCIFLVIHEMRENLSLGVYWLLIPVYLLTVVAFKTSAFVSMMIAVIRTINIVFPFKRIKKRATVMTIGMYTVFWVGIFSFDFGIELDKYLRLMKDISNTMKIHEYLISGFFYIPNRAVWIEWLAVKYKWNEKISNCSIELLYTGVPFLLCAIITACVTAVQLKVLLFPSGPHSDDCEAARRDKNKKMTRITITIILISIFFLLCASVCLYYPINEVCMYPSHTKDRRISYSVGYLPFFVNATVNPLILFIRVKAYRKFVVQKIAKIFKDKPGDGNSVYTTYGRTQNSKLTTLSHAGNSVILPPMTAHESEC